MSGDATGILILVILLILAGHLLPKKIPLEDRLIIVISKIWVIVWAVAEIIGMFHGK